MPKPASAADPDRPKIPGLKAINFVLRPRGFLQRANHLLRLYEVDPSKAKGGPLPYVTFATVEAALMYCHKDPRYQIPPHWVTACTEALGESRAQAPKETLMVRSGDRRRKKPADWLTAPVPRQPAVLPGPQVMLRDVGVGFACCMLVGFVLGLGVATLWALLRAGLL